MVYVIGGVYIYIYIETKKEHVKITDFVSLFWHGERDVLLYIFWLTKFPLDITSRSLLG